MLVYEYKLRLAPSQRIAIDAAIRTTQFVRNKALRLWMDGHGVSQDDLQALCTQLAQAYPFAAWLNSMARQAAADRAWQSIARFYKNCRDKKPGKKGYPRFRDKTTAALSTKRRAGSWNRMASISHNTLGMGIGRCALIGKKGCIETFPISHIKRVRLLKRADGDSVQFAVQAERQITHEPTGKQIGIDVGLNAFYTDSNGATVANPRYRRQG